MQVDVGFRDFGEEGFAQQTRTFELSGAVAAIGHHVYLAPTIDNAFAVVDAGYPGVGIYRSGTLVGVTGRNGTLLVPQLAPYADNTLAVREEDLPVDVDLQSPRQEVVPAEGAGVLVKFALPKIDAVTGTLRYSPARGGGSIDNYAITVTAPDGEVRTDRTGERGFFEWDGVVSGSYRIELAGASPACVATVHVPEQRPAIWPAGEVVCE